MDNVNRTDVIDADGVITLRIVEVLTKENEISIAKIRWLSKKNTNKTYGSIVVYLTKGNDVVKLL